MMHSENLKLFRLHYRKLADLVESTPVGGSFLHKNSSGEYNLKVVEERASFSLHSVGNIEGETHRWLHSLELEKVSLLVVYGIGLGYSYLALKKWLSQAPFRYLIFFEDNFSLFHHLMKMPYFSEIITHSQVKIFPYEKNEYLLNKQCKHIANYYEGLPYQVTALPSYRMKKKEKFIFLERKIYEHTQSLKLSKAEFYSFGRSYFRNFFQNILSLGEGHTRESIFRDYRNLPAIICGAGPSLSKNSALLKRLEKRALIFAGGSAINALSVKGIKPHFGASVDPYPTQFHRMLNHALYELPMFYKLRTHYQAYQSLHGPCIYLSGSPSYPITADIEGRWRIDDPPLPQGQNVLHLLMEIVAQMGCNPIIFVGMDLAFTGKSFYSEGVVSLTKLGDKTIIEDESAQEDALLTKDIYGQPIYTLEKWVEESRYSEGIPKKYPELTFINATEGGLGIRGVVNKTLQEVANEYLHCQFDLSGWTHSEVISSPKNAVSLDKGIEFLVELFYQLEDVLRKCQQMTIANRRFEGAISRKDGEAIDREFQQFCRVKEELFKNDAYKKIIYPINSLRFEVLKRKLQEKKHSSSTISEVEKLAEVAKTNSMEIILDHKAATVILEIMDESVRDFGKNRYGDVTDFFLKIKERVESGRKRVQL